jgi:hypothetical protein
MEKFAKLTYSQELLIQGIAYYYLLIKSKKEKRFYLFRIVSGPAKVLVGKSTRYELDEALKVFSFYNDENIEENCEVLYEQYWELKNISTPLELLPA